MGSKGKFITKRRDGGVAVLRSFNGPEPGGPESTIRSKGEKEADIPWFLQKANKAPGTGLALFTRASGTLLMG